MTVEVQPPQEIRSRWWNREAYQPFPRGNPGVQVDLDTLRDRGVQVGIPATTYPWPQMQACLDRAQAWDLMTWEGWASVQQQVQEARDRALAAEVPSVADLDAYVDVIEGTRRWWDAVPLNVEAASPGRNALAVQVAKELAKIERAGAGNLLYPNTLPIYQLFAAAEAVERVQAVLPLPPSVWAAMEPDSILPRNTLATLQDAERTYNTCHFVGRWLQAIGLQGADQFLGDEPRMALTFRRYAEAAEHWHELRTIPRVLRLAYVVDRNWGVGLWTRDDLRGVDQGGALRRFVPAILRRG